MVGILNQVGGKSCIRPKVTILWSAQASLSLLNSSPSFAPSALAWLAKFAPRLGKIEGLTDVLCVNVDKNQLKTLNMAAPRQCVPDMLKKTSRKAESMGAAECLAKDLDEIVKADQTLWQQEEKVGGGNDRAKDGIKRPDSLGKGGLAGPDADKKSSLVKKLLTKRVTNAKKHILSLEEKRQYETSVDAAVAFGKMIRSNFQNNPDNKHAPREEDPELATAPKYAAPSHDIDIGSVEACTVSENEGGEEDIRAALTCFFLYMYGDMGVRDASTIIGCHWTPLVTELVSCSSCTQLLNRNYYLYFFGPLVRRL